MNGFRDADDIKGAFCNVGMDRKATMGVFHWVWTLGQYHWWMLPSILGTIAVRWHQHKSLDIMIFDCSITFSIGMLLDDSNL